jgi:hypothetical protein
MTVNGTECAHVEQTAHLGIALLGDGQMLACAASTSMGFRAKANKGRNALARAFPCGQGLLTIEQNQQRQHDLETDAGQRQQTFGLPLKVGMLVHMGGNRFLDVTQRLL